MKFNYEIKPSNFFTLPDEKQAAVIGRFFALLSNLQKTAKILMIKEPLDVQIGNEIRRMQVLRTYLSSDESLENVLESLGYEYSVVLEMPSSKIKSESLHHLNMQGDYLAKCFTLYSLPATLGPAWVHSLLAPADMISITIKPIQHDKAVDLLNYGRQTITVEKVMVDGITSTYSIYKSDGTVLGGMLPVKEPVTLQASNTGKTVQILTTSGNLFDFSA